MNAPKESVTYKNSMNGAGQLLHRFAFSKIFPAETGQAEFFRDMVMPRMRDLMEGQNQLLFTYGATSSGKTYTIQGPSSDPGILPRSLDVIFNSIGDRQMTELKLKPNCFNRVVQMKDKDVRKLEEDKQTVFSLGIELAAAHHADKKNHHGDLKVRHTNVLCQYFEVHVMFFFFFRSQGSLSFLKIRSALPT